VALERPSMAGWPPVTGAVDCLATRTFEKFVRSSRSLKESYSQFQVFIFLWISPGNNFLETFGFAGRKFMVDQVAPSLKDERNLRHSTSRRMRAYDPLLDDDSDFPTEAEIAAMPDPAPLLPALATLIVEVISGVRPVDQMASLVSDQVYEKLRARVTAKAAADSASQRPRLAPKFAVKKVHHESPRIGVIESVVLVSTAARTRAITIRLEPIHKRWRATSVTVL
jgi:hypothetical protein